MYRRRPKCWSLRKSLSNFLSLFRRRRRRPTPPALRRQTTSSIRWLVLGDYPVAAAHTTSPDVMLAGPMEIATLFTHTHTVPRVHKFHPFPRLIPRRAVVEIAPSRRKRWWDYRLLFLSYWISTAAGRREQQQLREGEKPLGLDCRLLFDLINKIKGWLAAATRPRVQSLFFFHLLLLILRRTC